MEIFGKLEHLTNQGVIFWSKKNKLFIIQIFDQLGFLTEFCNHSLLIKYLDNE